MLPGVVRAQAQDESRWFVGAYYRHTWVPTFMLKPFFERGPSISNDGFGVTATHWSRSGVSVQLGLGYMPYHFEGAFNVLNAPVEETEYDTSKLALLHLTGGLLWPVQLHRMLSLEVGIGLDLGIITGSLRRSEAYPEGGAFRPCESALEPPITGPNLDMQGQATPYCEPAYDSRGNMRPSNPPNVSGGHYDVRENRVPPVMLVPMLPLLALRFSPHERVAIKFEAAFGVAQFFVGASVHFGLTRGRAASAAPPPPPPTAARVTLPAVAFGRVLGKLLELSTNTPIGGAGVKAKHMFSAIQTDGAGLFVFDRLEPGPVRFEITHPNYEAGSCDATIPAQGGDTMLHCFLRPQRKQGAISGQIKDEQGRPLAGARIEVTGPVTPIAISDADGLFAVLEAPEGTYRARVEAPGFLIQLIEFEVRTRETALPQIILLRAPEVALVKRKGSELALSQQVSFESDRAELLPSSDGLLREVADALLRNRDIALLEIQGHTDDRGPREHNLALSQARADAVRAWLVAHGIDGARLQATGYGPGRPLRANDTPEARAQNRRVQFIVKQTKP